MTVFKATNSFYKRYLFGVAAGFALVFALYHLIGIFYPVNTSPWWRHVIFIFVSLFWVYGFSKRPNYFVYFFTLLVAQQLYSHGTNMFIQWTTYSKIDWISIFLLPMLVILVVALYLERDK